MKKNVELFYIKKTAFVCVLWCNQLYLYLDQQGCA